MMPREIFTRTQQRETAASEFSKDSLPVSKPFGVSTCVKDGQDHNTFFFNYVMNYERKTAQDHSTADFAAHFWESFRVVSNALEIFLDCSTKFLAQAFAAFFIPRNRLIKFLRGNPPEKIAALHLPYLASSFALSSSIEMTSSGLSRCSCKRRSINSASPGVSSFDSTIPSQRLRQSSICSASGSVRASFKTVSESIMSSIYPTAPATQAGFLATRCL
jgi:hypothetical protein